MRNQTNIQKDDKFIRGFWFGIAGGVVKNLLTLIFYFLFKIHLTFLGYASVVVFTHFATNLFENLVALFAEITYGLTWSILFSYTLGENIQKHYVLKGFLYGLFIWFVLRVVIFLFRITSLYYHNPITALADVATAVAFGITLSLLHKRYTYPNFN
jgi:hypothetical protein